MTLSPVMENEDLLFPRSLFQAEFTWPEVYASLGDISYLSLRLWVEPKALSMLGKPFAPNRHYQPSWLQSVMPLPQPLSTWGYRYVPTPQAPEDISIGKNSKLFSLAHLHRGLNPQSCRLLYPTILSTSHMLVSNYVFLMYVRIILDQFNKTIKNGYLNPVFISSLIIPHFLTVLASIIFT